MNPESQEYIEKVWLFLDSIKPGNTYSVDKIVKPVNKKKYIEIVKDYMDRHPWQGHISFNHDYSKFYRIHSPHFE